MAPVGLDFVLLNLFEHSLLFVQPSMASSYMCIYDRLKAFTIRCHTAMYASLIFTPP